MYCNVVATKKLQVNETLLSDETTTRIITFIDYYDYTFSDVNVECKYFILMLDQLFETQPLQKQTTQKMASPRYGRLQRTGFSVNV